MRFICALLFTSLPVNAEAICRQFPRGQQVVAIASLLVTVAWYIAIVCACASAFV